MNKKTLQKIESRDRILNVASRLFKKNGFHATGIDEIMAEAGLTAGGFYAHFKNKTDLLEHTIVHSMNSSRQQLVKGLENLSGEEKIHAVISRYMSSAHRDFPEKGCILPALAAETYRGSHKSNEIVAKYLNSWAQSIMEHLPGTMSESERRAKAIKQISEAVGAILLSRMSSGTKISDEFLKHP